MAIIIDILYISKFRPFSCKQKLSQMCAKKNMLLIRNGELHKVTYNSINKVYITKTINILCTYIKL